MDRQRGRYYFTHDLLLTYIPASKIRTKPEEIKSRYSKIDFDCILCGAATPSSF